jgi:hypothetical protein
MQQRSPKRQGKETRKKLRETELRLTWTDTSAHDASCMHSEEQNPARSSRHTLDKYISSMDNRSIRSGNELRLTHHLCLRRHTNGGFWKYALPERRCTLWHGKTINILYQLSPNLWSIDREMVRIIPAPNRREEKIAMYAAHESDTACN